MDDLKATAEALDLADSERQYLQAIITIRQARNRWIFESASRTGQWSETSQDEEPDRDSEAQELAYLLALDAVAKADYILASFWAAEALACCRDSALKPHPGAILSTLLLGRSFAELGEFEKADEILQQTLETVAYDEDRVRLRELGAEPEQLVSALYELRAAVLERLHRLIDASAMRQEAERARRVTAEPSDHSK